MIFVGIPLHFFQGTESSLITDEHEEENVAQDSLSQSQFFLNQPAKIRCSESIG